MSANRINQELGPDTVTGPNSDVSKDKSDSIWPMIAAIDYLMVEMKDMSPMSAHFLRMARQNLLDEFFAKKTSDK
ncbi:hypothetical protein [Methyloligella solikamskensis]|uniref:Uncharacterized protein n=1 Tax=Methyloligella solikamskensis TaxID=1177756 RepID=A0ABW3J678_9HYPH